MFALKKGSFPKGRSVILASNKYALMKYSQRALMQCLRRNGFQAPNTQCPEFTWQRSKPAQQGKHRGMCA